MTTTFQASSKTFLLIPPIPTPNGRLHLGHIAGPFLRLDAATRYLRSRGHKALLVSGTDPYESYVTFHAEKEGTSPHQLARKYTLQIQNDLAIFDIDYDIWLDPLISPGREIYEHTSQQLLKRMARLDVASYNTRPFPYSAKRAQFLPRSFLAGHCPRCQSEVVGCLCEACGLQFLAEEVVEPYLRSANAQVPAEPLQWRDTEVLELCVPDGDERSQDFIADMKVLNIPSRQIDIIANYIRDQQCRVELTVPGSYGVPWQGNTDASQILYTYGAIYPFFLTVGEVFALGAGAGKSAFAVDADVVTITSYGSDTTIPWIAVPNILSHLDVDEQGQRQYRGCDYYWGNEFLCLHGAKFSTSRRHAIWASELIEKTPVNTDMARWYLASIDPFEQQTNFVVDGLVDTINQVVIDEIYQTVDVCLKQDKPDVVQAPSPMMVTLYNALFAAQDSCFDERQFYLQQAVQVVRDWIVTWQQFADKNPSDSYWFLKSLAIVSYPIMPNFAQQLWHHLGATDIPNMAQFDCKTTISTAPFQIELQYITQADIYPCLPQTLNYLINQPLSPSDDQQGRETEETCHV